MWKYSAGAVKRLAVLWSLEGRPRTSQGSELRCSGSKQQEVNKGTQKFRMIKEN